MQLNQVEKSKVETLFQIENDLVRAAAPHGLEMKRTKLQFRNLLSTISPDRLHAVESNMVSVLDVLTVCTNEEIDPWNDHEFFRLSMRSLQLSSPKDCLDNVKSGDLIEGYDLNRMQVFRNLQFMEYSNYSLIEILAFEWPMLFERSQAITEKMITFCDETLWSKNQTIPFNVPTHYMRELQTEHRQLYEIRFKNISPLFSGPDKPFGILGTCDCKLLKADPNDNLAFI